MPDVALAVLVRDGKVLIQRRFRARAGFVYEFPGGAIDAGESPTEAAARECWEEIGIRPDRLLGIVSKSTPTGIFVHFVVFATDQLPRAVEPARQQSFYWHRPEEIPLADFHPADRAFITEDLPELLS